MFAFSFMLSSPGYRYGSALFHDFEDFVDLIPYFCYGLKLKP